MPLYIYSTVSRSGALERGRGRFDDYEALVRDIESRGELLYNFVAVPDFLAGVLTRVRSKPRPAEVAEFCNTLAMYIGGGVDIQSALEDMLAAKRSRAMGRCLREIKQYLYSGYPLSAALKQTGAFPDIVINMVAIGEDSGNLDRTLADAGQHLERVIAIRGAVMRASLYPMVSFVVMIGVVIFWLAFIVPQLEQVFASFQFELPVLTQRVLAFGDWFAEYWLWVVVGLAAIPFVIKSSRQIKFIARLLDAIYWRLPIMKRLIRGAEWAFYFQYLGLTYRSGVVITQGLEVVRRSAGNEFFRHRLAPIEEELRAGMSLHQSLGRTQLFEPLSVRMIGLGEQTGNLEEQLGKLADIYYRRVQNLVEVFSKLIEPVIIVVIGIIFGIFVLALLGPIYQFVQEAVAM
ncbi:hypothetical protein CKO15_11745 [Halorhodospira abdelmalekii]|uniref:type II secretion system F family protein n=1 Tax=Halorhodospira abdelmalekii TaxID=421629 RepID=UPI0019079880|nr:type II secretion system F family protein [Halorhodospira abdelmalekii]MBK1735938.1 hypothetical protein [Halorhodospira abdelmalekii]